MVFHYLIDSSYKCTANWNHVLLIQITTLVPTGSVFCLYMLVDKKYLIDSLTGRHSCSEIWKVLLFPFWDRFITNCRSRDFRISVLSRSAMDALGMNALQAHGYYLHLLMSQFPQVYFLSLMYTCHLFPGLLMQSTLVSYFPLMNFWKLTFPLWYCCVPLCMTCNFLKF